MSSDSMAPDKYQEPDLEFIADPLHSETIDKNNSQITGVTSLFLGWFAIASLLPHDSWWMYAVFVFIPAVIALLAAVILLAKKVTTMGLLAGALLELGLNIYSLAANVRADTFMVILAFSIAAIMYGIRSIRISKKAENAEPKVEALLGMTFGSLPLILFLLLAFVIASKSLHA